MASSSSCLARPLSASGYRDEGLRRLKGCLLVSSRTCAGLPPLKIETGCRQGRSHGGEWGVVACSPPPCLGRVGRQRREGNVSLLSFGVVGPQDSGKTDPSKLLSGMLPYIVAATAAAALVNPGTFSWVSKEYYAPALGGIMLSIGVQLSISDFALAFQRPLPLFIGFMAQYVLKPMLGFLIARVFGAPPIFAAGFILTACVGGAQLSSYANYLGKGDVALSILLTSYTTISSVIITPLLTGLLIGSVVPVDGLAMSKSILQVVLVPVTLGLLLNTYAKAFVNAIRPVMPFLAMFCTSLCIGSPLAINRDQLLSGEGLRLLLPVLAFHMSAFIIGYWVSKLPVLRQKESVCRTISLCTGMQSSTLAGLLATQFLGGTHAVPAACSVVAMAIMGLCLASFWGRGLQILDLPSQAFSQISSTFTSHGSEAYS
ncbi:putative sodium/metabolite cotransporter [Nymphaea thermarum]|nr:putative sodium/metabolite cotransporter [Nymphaea thermarum]